MFEKETILHMAAYLKVRIAEEVLEKTDNIYPDNPEACERLERACSCIDAYESVLKELEAFYGREL